MLGNGALDKSFCRKAALTYLENLKSSLHCFFYISHHITWDRNGDGSIRIIDCSESKHSTNLEINNMEHKVIDEVLMWQATQTVNSFFSNYYGSFNHRCFSLQKEVEVKLQE